MVLFSSVFENVFNYLLGHGNKNIFLTNVCLPNVLKMRTKNKKSDENDFCEFFNIFFISVFIFKKNFRFLILYNLIYMLL